MKKILIINFILLLNIFTFFSTKAQNNYIPYYQIINQAELAIVDSSYKTALKAYQKAFTLAEKPFAKDYYNASICAILIKNKKLAFQYMGKFLQKGIIPASFTNKSPFKDFIAQYPKDFQKTIIANKPQAMNVGLKTKLTELLDKDQYFRLKENGYVVYKDSLEKRDQEDFIVLLNIFDKYGIPSENMIGVDSITDNLPHFLVLLHYCQRRSANKKMNNLFHLLNDAVKKGKLPPHTVSHLIDSQGDNDLPHYNTIALHKFCYVDEMGNEKESKWGYFKATEENTKKINQNREALGLETIEEYRKKAIFSLKDNNYFVFNLISAVSIFYFADPTQMEEMSKNLILIP